MNIQYDVLRLDPVIFTLLLLIASAAAGLLGSLTGLGGGVVIVPLLVLAFKIDVPYAVGASLIAVVANSSGSAAAYVRDGFTNVRVAILLETATVAGAIVGAIVAGIVSKTFVTTLFGLVALWSAYSALRPSPHTVEDGKPDPIATKLGLDSTWPSKDGMRAYHVRGVPGAFGVMIGAGVLSAIIGVGSGIVKVLAMDRIMRLPFKVSTTTSNFMMGVTAAAGSGVYLSRGQLEPSLCAPVALGALLGSMLGARLLGRMDSRVLRLIFAIAVAAAGVQMMIKGFQG